MPIEKNKWDKEFSSFTTKCRNLKMNVFKLQQETWNNWKYCVNKRISGVMESNIIVLRRTTGEKLSYMDNSASNDFHTLLLEIKYIQALQFLQNEENQNIVSVSSNGNFEYDIPEYVLEIYARREEFWLKKIKLMQITQYFNSLRDIINGDRKLNIVYNEFGMIEQSLERASSFISWQNWGKIS